MTTRKAAYLRASMRLEMEMREWVHGARSWWIQRKKSGQDGDDFGVVWRCRLLFCRCSSSCCSCCCRRRPEDADDDDDEVVVVGSAQVRRREQRRMEETPMEPPCTKGCHGVGSKL